MELINDFLIYLWDIVSIFFLNGFVSLFIVAKQHFLIFLGVIAVIYLMAQENEYIKSQSSKIKKRLM